MTEEPYGRSTDDEPDETDRSARHKVGAIVITLAIVCGAYRILVLNKAQHTSLVFIGLPAMAAFALLYTRPRTAIGTINKVIAVLLCLSGILFGEGLVCILFAAPIFFLVGTVIGYMLNRIMKKPGSSGRGSGGWGGAVALAIVPFSAEGVVPSWSFDRQESVTVTRLVAASPNDVEQTLASTPRFDRRLPFFLRLGFPTPIHVEGAGLHAGDERVVMFSHGQHHHGALTLRVASADARSVAFEMTGDESYITHWLSWDGAVVHWEPAAPGLTRVTWTLRYRRRLDPAWYFAPLERYGVGVAARYLIETLATPSSTLGSR